MVLEEPPVGQVVLELYSGKLESVRCLGVSGVVWVGSEFRSEFRRRKNKPGGVEGECLFRVGEVGDALEDLVFQVFVVWIFGVERDDAGDHGFEVDAFDSLCIQMVVLFLC